MRIGQLAQDGQAYKDSVAFVLGTGPSMRFFPLRALEGAFVLGLNQAWKYHRCNFMLTAHPELYKEYEATAPVDPMRWIIKKKAPMAELELDDPKHHVFLTSPDLVTVKDRPADTLYLGEGIQCTAMDLLARMGFRTIILVGVDMNSIGGEFHGHDQHVRWLGQAPKDQYALYRKSAAKVRSILRDSFNVDVLTLSPFLGINSVEEEHTRLRAELKLAPLPKPKDISPYLRVPPPKLPPKKAKPVPTSKSVSTINNGPNPNRRRA